MFKKISICLMLTACHNQPSAKTIEKATSYDVELTLCNNNSKTFEDSVYCENEVRKRYNRPPRVQ